MHFSRTSIVTLSSAFFTVGCSISSGTLVEEESDSLPQVSEASSGGMGSESDGGAAPGEEMTGTGGQSPASSGGQTMTTVASGGASSQAGSPVGLRLNELMRGSAAFVELVNEGSEVVSLSGVLVGFGQDEDDFEPSCSIEEGSLAPGEFFVVTKHGECPSEWGPCQPGCDIAPLLAQSSVATSDTMYLFWGTERLDETKLPTSAEFPVIGETWSRLADDSQWVGRVYSPGEANGN